ncbi:MAG: S9 family peptidase [Myxococcales bacterium]|nr:S9 family peptidase [Myxococcales bacterium]
MGPVLLLWALAQPVAAADTPPPLSPYDALRLRSVGELAISPDGDHVAFTVTEPRRPLDEPDGPSRVHLWHGPGATPSPKGKRRVPDARPLVTGDAPIIRPEFTPDGRTITFLQLRAGDAGNALYGVATSGGDPIRLTRAPRAILDYAHAPDGKQVAFLVGGAIDNGAGALTSRGMDHDIYEESQQPTVVNVLDLTPPVAGADAPAARPLALPGSASTVAWSSRGMLAVAVAPTPTMDDFMMARRIHFVDPAPRDGKVTHVIDTQGKLGAMDWSPDGERLAFIASRDENDPKDGRLRVASLSGELNRFFDDLDGHVTAIAWRDATRVVALIDRGVRTEVVDVDVTGPGAAETRLASERPLTGLAVARTGRFVTAGESPEHPLELFTGDLTAETVALERRTTLNPWLAQRRLAPQTVVRHTARDGTELEGVLIAPERPEGATLPLILVVHGGPEAHVRNGWLTNYASPGQVAAGRGYAVFHPNYRGSTGRGVAFSQLGQGDPAGKEFDDLVDAVKHLVETGLVDRERVGITGGSYGGYAAAWAATALTEHFAAAVMFVGISELIAKAATTDIPTEEALVHARSQPWERWALLAERSPLRYVERARTPILIAHGKDDPRVHPSQSLMLYRFLNQIGKVPVRLVLYPGEGHGNRRTSSRLDYQLRVLEWFDHYLSGPGRRDAPPPPRAIDYRKAAGLPAPPKKDGASPNTPPTPR